MTTPALLLNAVSARRQHKTLFEGVTFQVGPSFFFGVVGLNGVGKTSLLRAILGELAYDGSIKVMGKEVKELAPRVILDTISFLPQAHRINFPVSVKELVVMGRFRHNKGFRSYQKEDYVRAHQNLEALGVEHLWDRSFSELSGGEQQLVWVAQLVTQDTPVLLLDEPTQGLDIRNKALLFEYLECLARQKNKCIVCVTHELEFLQKIQGAFLTLDRSSSVVKPINPENIHAQSKFLRG